MARISKVTTLTQPIWPDKTIYTGMFADQPPTPDHATPQTADPAWNDLITDYISSTDSSVQTIASALGLGALGSATNDTVKISPPTGWSPTAITNLDNLLELNMNGFTMPTGSVTLRMLGVTGTTNIAAGTTFQVQGLAFFPTIAFGAAGGTLSNLNSITVGASLTASAAFNLTTVNSFNSSLSLSANGTYTTVKGIANTVTPAGTATTVVGLDVQVGSGGTVTNRIAIRDTSLASATSSRLNSKLRLGDQTAPTQQLEVAGNAVITGTLTNYNGVATVGFGVPTIVAEGDSAGTPVNGTVASVCTYTPAANAVLKVGGDIDVTAFTSGTILMQVTYTDWAGNSQTVQIDSVTALADAPGNEVTIMAQASTAVTVLTTGVFTASYNYAATITRYK